VTNPFTVFAFPATGTSTSRTLPNRLAEIKNVRDFGAVGDGVTDDLPAIMAAFNSTVGANRGKLYFPPGTYYVSAPIDISTLSSFVHLLGDMGASTIVGNFADYIIKRYLLGSNAQSGGHIVERLRIINRHASGGGIRMGVSVGAAIRDCDITANFCIDTDNSDVFGPPGDPGAYWYSLEVSISNCNLRSYSALAAGSTGLARGANGPTTNCTFTNFDAAIRAYGGQGGMTFQGCYFETNNVGFANATGPGIATIGGTNGTGNIAVLGCHFKNNGTAIGYTSGGCKYSGLLIEAAEGTIAGNPQYGIYIPQGGGSCSFVGIKVTGQFQVAGIYYGGGETTKSPTSFAGVSVSNTSTLGGVAWHLPSTAMSIDAEGCNVAPVFTVAKLPGRTYTVTSASWSGGIATLTVTGAGDLPTGQLGNVTIAGVTPSGYNGTFQNVTVPNFFTFRYPVGDPGGVSSAVGSAFFTTASDTHKPNAYEGDCYNVSDANTATWGDPVIAGGGSNHCKVRFTGAAWTVVGK
jgi:hypothetical protein